MPPPAPDRRWFAAWDPSRWGSLAADPSISILPFGSGSSDPCVLRSRHQSRILNLFNDPRARNHFRWSCRAGLRQLPERVPEPLAHGREHCPSALALPKLRTKAGVVGECAAGEWIGWRYPLVELAVGALWSTVAWRGLASATGLVPSDLLLAVVIYGLSQMILLWLLVALSILDFENLWLPDKVTIPGILIGFATTLLYAAVSSKRVFAFYGALELRSRFMWDIVWQRLLAILAAAGLILLIRWVYWLIRRREGIGLGDAKLMAMLAAWLGLPGALLAFGLGAVLGAIAALVLLVLPSTRENKEGWAQIKLPLGTFLCVGGIVSSLWGERIIDAYRRWAGF